MAKPKPLPSIAQVQSIFNYDQHSGVFYWKINAGTNKTMGNPAGCVNRTGYVQLKVAGKLFLAHRLAWLVSTGQDPVGLQIDHINGIKIDNRLCNLRLATNSQNSCNKKLSRRNTSGYKGVSYSKQGQKWRADIRINGKQTLIGLFDTPELAHMAYCEAAAELHGDFARGA
jgi:hypothetical protein